MPLEYDLSAYSLCSGGRHMIFRKTRNAKTIRKMMIGYATNHHNGKNGVTTHPQKPTTGSVIMQPHESLVNIRGRSFSDIVMAKFLFK